MSAWLDVPRVERKFFESQRLQQIDDLHDVAVRNSFVGRQRNLLIFVRLAPTLEHLAHAGLVDRILVEIQHLLSVLRFKENTSGICSESASTAVVSGKSTFTRALPTIAGTVIMNTIKSTSITSTSGVTLMPLIASSSSA